MMIDLKRILLVEDNPSDIDLTLTALEEQNLANEVVSVNDGEEALDYLYKRGRFAQRPDGNPACVLLDLKMPKVNGKEVLLKIKSDKRTKKIPVVVLTSSKEDPDIEECYDLGVNGYVVKPVEFDAFHKAISDLGLYWMIVNQSPQ